jgi:Ca-activated chloride channel family protein
LQSFVIREVLLINWALPRELLFLIAVPVLLVLGWIFNFRRRKVYRRAVAPELLFRININGNRVVAGLRMGLFILGLLLLSVALARPRWGEKLQLYKGRGIAVVVALDASKSMLATDVKPDRLTRAKTELSALIDELEGNAVGIVSFAGDAYVLCPLTTDLEAAKLFLDIISPDLMPVPGTDFGKAIATATGLFNPSAGTKALVLVTDGEDLGRNTEQAVLAAKEAGVRIYPVAISTPEGAPIPEPGPGGMSYKKDKNGNVIISRMDERKLIMIAQLTGGRFYRLEGFSAERLRAELDRLEKEELGGGEFSHYVERYQGFLLAGLLALFLALFIPERKIIII